MRMVIKSVLGLLYCSLIALPAFAQQGAGILPEGQTLLTLSVTERARVEQDTLVATLRIELEHRDAVALQNQINSAMENALELVGEAQGITVSTGFYSVYQYNRQPQASRSDPVWRGSQSLVLESREAVARMLELAGELQTSGFVMNQLVYRLSSEQADRVRDELMEQAIQRAREKVERAARALGRPDTDISSLEVDADLLQSPPGVMRSVMALESADAMSAPSARAGETEVTLTVRVQAVAR